MDETFAGMSLAGAIGQCRGCRTRGELGTAGFCGNCAEDFIVVEGSEAPKGIYLPPEAAVPGRKEPIGPNATKASLLDFIVMKATGEFIETVYKAKFEEFRQSQKWIEWLEQEPNERKLLRLATQLGYGKKPRKPRTTRTAEKQTKIGASTNKSK